LLLKEWGVPDVDPPRITRRRVLGAGLGLAGIAATGGVGYAVAPQHLKARLGLGADPFIPAAPEGQIRLETLHSKARGRDVGFFTAVPAGLGDGAGLPVVVILHGASATAARFRGFGFGRFLTQAVRNGATPFVLAGADGGVLRWEKDPSSEDDPQTMVHEEIPQWLASRGFDADRRALWGWSIGGYGSLRFAERYPGWARSVAVFSPAVANGDAVFADEARLAGVPLAVWCGRQDGLYPAVRDLVTALPSVPEIASFTAGAHTRFYWNDQTLAAFSFLGRHLSR
jgi:pimeloyl-ACP methyl ester carboxylesterase